MKKLISGILAFFYLAFTSGIVVNIHYCMGKPHDIEYAYQNNKTCGNCGMENRKGCCHNDLRIIKLADDQQVAKVNFTLPALTIALPAEYPPVFCLLRDPDAVSGNGYHSPPDKMGSSHYLFLSVFRI